MASYAFPKKLLRRLTQIRVLIALLVLARVNCSAFHYVYDDNNQLIKVVYSAQREVSYAYDPAGNILSITVSNVVSPPLLALNQDIGTPAAPGNSGYTNGLYSVQGSGDIGGTADAFHFVYHTLTGDGEIIAQVTGLSDPAGSGLAKAGIMMRENLLAASKHALVLLTSGNGTSFQSRAATGGATTSVTPQDGAQPPRWLKLVRQGSTLTGYQSANGTAWTLVGTASLVLPSQLYVGLAVSSHDPALLSTATFAQVQITDRPASGPGFALTIRLPSAFQVELTWNTITNWNYQVQYCSELASQGGTNAWQVLKTGISGNGSPVSATDSLSPASQTPRYYRVSATPSP